MIHETDESKWKQHFPTYNFKKRDIAIEEYKTACKNLESEERVFLNASNLSLVAATALGSLTIGSLNTLVVRFKDILPPLVILSSFFVLTFCFSIVNLNYFANRQKSVVYGARKVIVLRRMLSMSYGSFQLVLPNWRIEGADEPFSVRLFPGWFTYVTYPFYALAGISAIVEFFLLAAILQNLQVYYLLSIFNGIPQWTAIIGLTIFWVLLLGYVYRFALLDIHERPLLMFTQNISRLMRLSLVSNFEYVIYRANLARFESTRMKINLQNLEKMTVFIEDRSFYEHHGISLRAICRAILGLIRMKRRSGGSTITQQIVRTLFIKNPEKLLRRKIAEILLAIWFDRVFPKNIQLEMYLASVRFERGQYGLISAMKYFWGHTIKQPNSAQAFFLIERVSNIQSKLLINKIRQMVRSAMEANLLSQNDVTQLQDIYKKAIADGKIKYPNNEVLLFMPSRR